MKATTLFSIVILSILAIACSGQKKEEATQEKLQMPVEEKSFFDKLELKTMDGKAITVADLDGKMAFINVWATFCAPCLKEMPSIERAKAKLESEGYMFLAISNEEHNKIQNFIAKNDYTFDFAELGMGLEALNIYALPASYIVDGKGNLVYEYMGAKEWDSPENILMFESLLKN